jgi:sulfur carrier protein ThiS
MKITVKLIGHLIYQERFSEKIMAFPASATAGDALARLRLNKRGHLIVVVNGRAVNLSEALKDGDRVVVSPIYSGG